MKRRRPGKNLEKAARAVSNSDEFVAHVAGIAALYRREREVGEPRMRSELRQSLRVFERHAGALAAWLEKAQTTASLRADAVALKLIREQAQQSGALVAGEADLQAWLSRAAAAATRVSAALKAKKHADSGKAVRMAAEALRATFEHHKLKWSMSLTRGQPAPALSLLCAIASDAGDKSVTPTEARKALRSPAAA